MSNNRHVAAVAAVAVGFLVTTTFTALNINSAWGSPTQGPTQGTVQELGHGHGHSSAPAETTPTSAAPTDATTAPTTAAPTDAATTSAPAETTAAPTTAAPTDTAATSAPAVTFTVTPGTDCDPTAAANGSLLVESNPSGLLATVILNGETRTHPTPITEGYNLPDGSFPYTVKVAGAADQTGTLVVQCATTSPSPSVQPKSTALYLYQKVNPNLPAGWTNSGSQTLVKTWDGFSWATSLTVADLPQGVCGPGWAVQQDEGLVAKDAWPAVVDRASGTGVLTWPPIVADKHSELSDLISVPQCATEAPPKAANYDSRTCLSATILLSGTPAGEAGVEVKGWYNGTLLSSTNGANDKGFWTTTFTGVPADAFSLKLDVYVNGNLNVTYTFQVPAAQGCSTSTPTPIKAELTGETKCFVSPDSEVPDLTGDVTNGNVAQDVHVVVSFTSSTMGDHTVIDDVVPMTAGQLLPITVNQVVQGAAYTLTSTGADGVDVTATFTVPGVCEATTTPTQSASSPAATTTTETSYPAAKPDTGDISGAAGIFAVLAFVGVSGIALTGGARRKMNRIKK